MLQDLCRPERTHRGLSLAFIRRRGEEGRWWLEGGGSTLGEERQKQRGGEGEGIGSEEGGAESMPSIKQEGLCCLKLVRAEPRGVYRKSVLMGCTGGGTKYPAIYLRLNGEGGEKSIYLSDKRQKESFVSQG